MKKIFSKLFNYVVLGIVLFIIFSAWYWYDEQQSEKERLRLCDEYSSQAEGNWNLVLDDFRKLETEVTLRNYEEALRLSDQICINLREAEDFDSKSAEYCRYYSHQQFEGFTEYLREFGAYPPYFIKNTEELEIHSGLKRYLCEEEFREKIAEQMKKEQEEEVLYNLLGLVLGLAR